MSEAQSPIHSIRAPADGAGRVMISEEATGLYRELFTHLGAGRVSGLRPVTRDEANAPAAGRLMDEATGVFLTGGNQLRLASVVGGTDLGAALLRAHERGAVIAGTSA